MKTFLPREFSGLLGDIDSVILSQLYVNSHSYTGLLYLGNTKSVTVAAKVRLYRGLDWKSLPDL